MEIMINICIYAGIVQGFYMALLLNHNKRINPANKYLAILLVTMSISIAHTSFAVPVVHRTLNNPFQIKEPFLMLVIPLIWLYVKKLEEPLFLITPKISLHFLPFIFFMSFSIPAFIGGSGSGMAQFLVNNSLLFNCTIWAVLALQYSAYLYQLLKISKKCKLKAEQELSNIEYVDISWLNTFLYAFFLVFLVLAIIFISVIHNLSIEWMNQVLSLFFSITIFYLGYKGLFQRSIFSNTDAPNTTFIPEQIIAETSKLKPVDENITQNLLEYMDKHKPHRESELSLGSLAKQLNISRNSLSEIINNSVGCNFYDFVNKYRVEDVKSMMNDPKNKDFTLLAIAFDAGFPSKSTFNSIFKKFTGLTPSEYRKGLSLGVKNT